MNAKLIGDFNGVENSEMRQPKSTEHFRERQAKRGLRKNILEFVMENAEEIRTAGVRFLSIRSKRFSSGEHRQLAERSHGWVIVAGRDGTLRTCYRSERALRKIKKKQKWDRRPRIARSLP